MAAPSGVTRLGMRGEGVGGEVGKTEAEGGIWVVHHGVAGVLMERASRTHSSREDRETGRADGMQTEAVAKAGAVTGKTEEAEGQVIKVEEVGGVIGIPIEAEGVEEVAGKVEEMDRAIGTSVEVVVRDEAAETLEADRFYASLV